MKTKKLIQGHQGDVQFIQTANIPNDVKKTKNKPLAYGEISGHIHVLTGDVEFFEVEGRTFAVVGSDGARLQHIHESSLTENNLLSVEEIEIADHKSIALPKGKYEFGIQKAYDPYEKIFKKVED